MAHLVSVNVGAARTIEQDGRSITTGIFKRPVEGRVAVRGVNLDGDDQADRSVHGGPDKAVYSYAREDYDWWGSELGEPLEPGTFGENVTLLGLDLGAALIGERWRIGSTELEVSEPRFPCFKLGLRMGDPRFPKRFAAAGRPGAYLRVVREGELGAGDGVEARPRPDHGVTIAAFAHAFLRDRDRLGDLLAAEQLSPKWRSWIAEATARRAARGP